VISSPQPKSAPPNRQHRPRALFNKRTPQVQPDDFVFHSERGTPLNPYNVLSRAIHPACKRAGLRPVSWHVFRYTYSTWADPTGESIKAMQAQLGHTNSKLTLSVYTQPMPTAQRQVASKVADVLHRVLLPIAPKFEGNGDGGEEKKSANSMNLKQSRLVGAIGFEPMTSTV